MGERGDREERVRGPPGEAFERSPSNLFETVAQVCHEANRVYCQSLGDDSQPEWKDAPDWQRQSALNGVRFHYDNQKAPASASHDNWLAEKERDGWKYGPVKDPEAKEHPCMVPFYELDYDQRRKDFLFRAIVHAFIDAENDSLRGTRP